MSNATEITKSENRFIGFTCDRCATVVDIEADLRSVCEAQEALHIDFLGGYGSVFGDGYRVQCDLCQSCLHVLIKDFCRITDTHPEK